jgi:hypothetical protein
VQGSPFSLAESSASALTGKLKEPKARSAFRKPVIHDIGPIGPPGIPVCANERITHTGSASMLGERMIGSRMSPNKTALSLGRFDQFLPYFFKRGCLLSKYRPIWPKAEAR